MATLLSWEPTVWKNHLYHHSPRFPPHASFPRIKIRKNLKNLSINCFFTAANSKRNECLTSGREISKNGLGKIEIKQNPIEIVAKTIKTLQKSAAAAVLVGLLLMYNPYNNFALAASGGSMGGSSFSSSSSYSDSSSSSFSDSSSSSFSNSDSDYLWDSDESHSAPKSESNSAPKSKSNSALSTFDICLIVIVIALVVIFVGLYFWYESSTATEGTSVLKLQVGLLDSARSLQKDLNQIAETADTSTPEGLHYVLTETVLALLQYPDYCIYGDSFVDVKWSMKEGEKKFYKLSSKERGKFDELTLVNFNNFKKQSLEIRSTGGHRKGYIVVTILVAYKGGLKLPKIRSSNDLKEALQKIASIPSRRTLAVEVLWTPQKEDDTLSKQQLLQDYPFLRSL